MLSANPQINLAGSVFKCDAIYVSLSALLIFIYDGNDTLSSFYSLLSTDILCYKPDILIGGNSMDTTGTLFFSFFLKKKPQNDAKDSESSQAAISMY